VRNHKLGKKIYLIQLYKSTNTGYQYNL